MAANKSFWRRVGLHDWFLKRDPQREDPGDQSLTPDEVFDYILEKFNESIKKLSFAGRVVFYHEYIICFNTEDYQEFMEHKKGLFGLIVHESVRTFHQVLNGYRQQGKTVVPSSNKWVFRFVSHPDYAPGDKGFIGKLMPDTALKKEDNLRITFIPRQTGIAQTQDVNQEILQGFNYYTEGYYELPFEEGLGREPAQRNTATGGVKARLETILPDKEFAGKKMEYMVTDAEVTVSGIEETQTGPGIFRIPSDWVNTPHLRIRYSGAENKFWLASFGEKTVLNEQPVPRSSPQKPEWTELPINSQMVLNGIVGINIYKA